MNYTNETTNPVQINCSKDLAKIIKNNNCVIIKFSASWCGPCKNKVFLQEYYNLKSKYANVAKIIFTELDVDNHESIINDKTYYDIEISSVPCFLIATNGNFTNKFEGTTCLKEIDMITSQYVK